MDNFRDAMLLTASNNTEYSEIYDSLRQLLILRKGLLETKPDDKINHIDELIYFHSLLLVTKKTTENFSKEEFLHRF